MTAPAARFALVLVVAMAGASCNEAPETTTAASNSAADQSLLALDRIAAECSLPRSNFSVEGGQVRFRPNLDERYENVNCGVQMLRNDGLISDIPMGFVGIHPRSAVEANAQAH